MDMRRLILLFVILCSGAAAAEPSNSARWLPQGRENYPHRSDYLWLTVPDHADWLYKVGEKARVEVSFYLYGMPQDVEVNYGIGQDMLPDSSKGKVKLRNGRATIDMGTMKKPGFLDLRLSAVVAGKTYQHHVKVGFSPEQLKPYTQDPADFDTFWQKNIEDARKTPVSVSSKRVAAYSTDDFDCYLLKLRTDNRHSIYGYLTKPKASGKYPVVLCPPGAGIKTIKEPMRNTYYAKNGFIRLEMEIHGLNPEMTEEQFKEISTAFSGENGYVENGLDNRDNYYMKHVYTACVRAIDYLTSLPEWDGRNVFVQGGSQGGALSIVTAALDKRVTACVANHPALSDMAGYAEKGRTGGWPHLNRENQMLTPQKIETLRYYDVVNFARRLTCPVYLTWGYNDNTCPPTTSYIVWNLITAPKESLVTPINEHWTTPDTNYGQMLWLKGKMKE
jgi:cephalosporin-C deacetylase-like acetyl esterase